MIARAGLVFAALCWAGNFAVGRVFADDIGPMTLNTLRWSVALCFLLPLSYRQIPAYLPGIRANIVWLLKMSCSGVVYHALVYLALAYTTVTNMALIISATPAMTLIFSHLLHRQRYSLFHIAVVALSFLGITVLVWGRLTTPNTGDVLGCVALVLWGYYNVSLRDCPAELPGLVLTTAITFLGVLLMLPLLAIEIYLDLRVQFSVPLVAGVLYVGLFSSAIAFFLWNRGSMEIGQVFAAQYMNLVPVFGVAIGVLILGEPFTLRHGVAAALVITSLLITELRIRPSEPSPGRRLS